MQHVTKEKFLEWKENPVTRAQDEALNYRIEEIKDQILGSSDPDYDRFLKGMARGFSEVLHATVESVQLTEEDIDNAV